MWGVFLKHGDTLYGSTANMGNGGAIFPHIRTTGYFLSTKLLNQYPHRITGAGRFGDRYEYEHGKTGLTTWIKERRLQPLLVSWTGVHREPEWDHVPNGFRNGDQSNILCGDRLSRKPYGLDP